MSLMWKTTRPSSPGWYWMKQLDGRAVCIEVARKSWGLVKVDMNGHVIETIAASRGQWAGPIARPVEPSSQQLATVRYQLNGANLPPSTGGWGSAGWEFVPRAEMLRRARVHLCGGADWEGKPWPADSEWVHLYSSTKRNGRWCRQPGEKFTAANIDAAIAACAPKSAELAHA